MDDVSTKTYFDTFSNFFVGIDIAMDIMRYFSEALCNIFVFKKLYKLSQTFFWNNIVISHEALLLNICSDLLKCFC